MSESDSMPSSAHNPTGEPTWEDWRARARAEYPVRYFISERLLGRIERTVQDIRDAYWWARHRIDPRHRYHVVKTGLPPGYYDPCDRILASVMNEVTRFVAGPRDPVDWAFEDGHREAWEALTKAADWWSRHRDHLDDIEDDEDLSAEAVSMLTAVMRVRGYMWFP